MTKEEKAAIKELFPEACFLRIIKGDLKGIIALPKKQDTPEKEAAVSLWHGSTVRLPE